MAGNKRSGQDGGSDERTQFRAFLADDESKQVIDQVIKELVIPHASLHKGGIRSAIGFLSEHRSPKILIVDLSNIDLPLSAVNDLAEVCEPGVTVIALGDRNDVGLFRELINSGISDYLVKPLTPALLQKSLLASVDGETRSRQTSKLGRLVTVIGSRGGVGCTMTATALAYHIAEVRRRRVALVDLDLKYGTVSLALDLEPSHGYREALENGERIDSLYIDRSLTKFSDTLFVISAEESIESNIAVEHDAIDKLIRELRAKFHYVIIDAPRSIIGEEHMILEDTSNLIMVTDLSLAGMRDTVRITNEVSNRNVACQISVVANRCGEFKAGEIPKSEFEKGISKPLTTMMPFDNKTIASAMNLGKPVASLKSPLSSSFEILSEILCGGSSVSKNKSILSRIIPSRKGS